MKQIPFKFIVLGFLFLGAAFVLPWRMIDWGNVALKPARTITVQGSAKMQVTNQKAMFSAGVNAVNDSRERATEDVNRKIQDIITALKTAGISESDIKTQNLNIFQNEEVYYENGIQKTRLGQWRVSNNVEISLKDLALVNEIPNILTAAGANNVWGPNYSLEDTGEQEKELLKQAIENARTKAETVASSTGKKLGDLLSVQEGYVNGVFPALSARMYGGGGGGGGEGLMPGSGTVQKDVTVSFELK